MAYQFLKAGKGRDPIQQDSIKLPFLFFGFIWISLHWMRVTSFKSQSIDSNANIFQKQSDDRLKTEILLDIRPLLVQSKQYVKLWYSFSIFRQKGRQQNKKSYTHPIHSCIFLWCSHYYFKTICGRFFIAKTIPLLQNFIHKYF